MPSPLSVGDLLYHSVHGLCRINEVIETPPGKTRSYALVPKIFNKMKLRFVIPESDLPISGFHVPISSKEANEILESFARGYVKVLGRKTVEKIPLNATASERSAANKAAILDKPTFAEDNGTWALANSILACSHDDITAKDKRRSQTLERSARGLVHEIAFALNISAQEAVVKILQSLQRRSKVHPLVLTALHNSIPED